MSTDKKFNFTLKQLLSKNASTEEKELKAKYATQLFDFVVENKEIFDRPAYVKLRTILLDKLKSFKKNNSDIIDADKYLKILYPDYHEPQTLEDLDDICNKLVDMQNKNPNATIQEINKHMNIELPIIDNYIPQKHIDFIFDDYTLNKITSKHTHFDMDFENAIVYEITKKYITCDKNIVLSMLKENKTINQIKNDETYNNGPFLIKLSDYMYELYEKEIKMENKRGYFFNTILTSTVTIHKIGKYCKL